MSLLNTPIPTICRSERTNREASKIEGPVQKPSYAITESTEAFALTVDLPGVAKDGLEVTSDTGEIRIVGRRNWKRPEGWTSLHRESVDSTYELVLTYDNALNNEKITAQLRDGVLNVTLPKAEEIKPRKITVG
ncbi:MAG: heat-shock protein Hsp20 [Opitutaceae bacterium]|nr:heat-shock protein Hsp20 [Opitutaceae bacterium]|tara:strand:- start:3127 stop:3528 length:402 start_codon:yes stop_codon:yes gene_type:complete